jgi:hypothetical protein
MRRLAVIVVAVAAFLAVAFFLARWLSTENVERDRVTELLGAQARGDGAAMLDLLDGCARRPACAAAARNDARALRSPGKVEIVLYESGTSYSLGAATGRTRVVWRTPSRLTTVQCVDVRRTGNVLSGPSVSLTGLSEPIGRTSSC